MEYPSQKDMPAAAAEQALWHAQLIVPMMKENSNVTLDYSPDSLRHLDDLLKMFHKNGITTARVPKIIFQVGCYLGQVVVNACPGSTWKHPKDIDTSLDMSDLVIQHPDNVIWAPITTAAKVLQDPANNNLLSSCLGAIKIYGAANRA
jgi:hypothetical protein